MSRVARRVYLILSVVFAAVTLASAVTLSFQRGRSVGDSVLDVAIWALSGAGVILVLNAAAGVWALRASRRATRLAGERPDSIVVESARLGGLQGFLITEGAVDPVQYVAVTFDHEGVTFWRDYSPPRIWRQVEATSATSIGVEEFIQNNRIRLRFRIARPVGDILIPVLGQGLVRLMSPSREIVEGLADTIAERTKWSRG